MGLSAISTASPTPPITNGRRSLQADTLAASVVILLVATVVQRTVGFGRGVLFCRWLTPEALGEWEMVYSFLMIAAPLAVLGVPGSFGRYAEHYRQRGHLKTFLHRTAVWTTACTLLTVALCFGLAPQLSKLVFGDESFAPLMQTIAGCLAAIILHHTLTALLTAMRLYRVVSTMNFAQSLLFAAISLVCLWHSPSIAAIVESYAAACLIASVGALAWSWPALRHIDQPADRLHHSEFWGKLLRFAFFVWVTNLLTNLFGVIDRYMLVHYSGMSPAEALDQIGHYHTSRIIPLLMVSVAELLSTMVMPHLSHDWEAGRREHASARLNLAIRLTTLGMIAFGACVLAAGPLMFGVVLQGRYDVGFAVLPWTLAGCVWYSIYLVAQTYLWCAERTRLTAVPLMCGLAVNILSNLVLLPAWGLHGAVASTGLATLTCLAVVLELNRRQGMHVDRRTWLLAVMPLPLAFGYWPTIIACGLLAVAAVGTELILSASERRELKTCGLEMFNKVTAGLRRQRATSAG